MTDPIEFLANGLAAAGVDPAAKAIERPAYIPAGDWLRVQRLARAIVMQRLPERQRRLVELVYTTDCDEVVTEAVSTPSSGLRAPPSALREATGRAIKATARPLTVR